MKTKEIGIENKKATKEKIRRKKRLRFFKNLFICLMFFIVLIFIALSPIFNISKIDVKSSTHYNENQIISALRINVGLNAFKAFGKEFYNIPSLRYKDCENILLSNFPYLKEAKVKLILPTVIKVETVERIPVAIANYGGTNLIIDEAGYVLETIVDIEKVQLPLIKGLDIKNFGLGKAIITNNIEGLTSSIKIIKKIPSNEENEKNKQNFIIKAIDISDSRKVYLDIDSRIKVNFGESKDIDYKIEYLKQILQKGIKKEDKGVIDFTTGNNPNFIPF